MCIGHVLCLLQARHTQDIMHEIKTYIKSRIDKARETYSDERVRSLLDLYIQRCNKTDSESTITGERFFFFYSGRIV